MATILIIEDDLQVLTTLSEVLSSSGFIVRGLSTAIMALEELNIETSVSIPECVVLDYSIHGLDAVQFISRLKSKFPNIKIILSSGYPEHTVKNEISFDQVDYFISKPFRPSDLARRIDRVLMG